MEEVHDHDNKANKYHWARWFASDQHHWLNIPEALTATETKRAELDMSGISPVAAIVLAMDVERIQMLAAPVKDDLEDRMQVRQGCVAADEEAAPDQRTDLTQDNTQLIDTGRFRWLAHRVSVAQCAVSLKISTRNLTLSGLAANVGSGAWTRRDISLLKRLSYYFSLTCIFAVRRCTRRRCAVLYCSRAWSRCVRARAAR